MLVTLPIVPVSDSFNLSERSERIKVNINDNTTTFSFIDNNNIDHKIEFNNVDIRNIIKIFDMQDNNC